MNVANALAAVVLVIALIAPQRAGAQSIDLLRGARTDVAVSSAYRDRVTQVAALVDGDLETAWNSRTGDLVGAWIEVRLPDDATVTSIALTAGFTKQNGQTDLFTGNHRVARVRVLREGREVGVFPLDRESRALQTLPVQAGGGTYRIEVAEVVPGTRAQWREVCISELRVMGRAPGARDGQRFPRLAVGALPAPRPDPASVASAQVQEGLRDMMRRLVSEWGALNDAHGDRRQACGLDEQDISDTSGFLQRRRGFLGRLAELVELVDELEADQIRAAAYLRGSSDGYGFLDPNDHELVAGGFQAVVDRLGDAEARCRWASADSWQRLRRSIIEVRALNHVCEHLTMDYPDGAPREQERQCNLVDRILPRMEELENATPGRMRSTAPRIGRLDPTALGDRVRSEWTGLQSSLAIAAQSCGWSQ